MKTAKELVYDAIDRLYFKACGYDMGDHTEPRDDVALIKQYLDVMDEGKYPDENTMIADLCESLRDLADAYGGDKKYNEHMRVSMWRVVNALANVDGVKNVSRETF